MNWTFFNMTRRIEFFFFEHESKNWIFEFLSKKKKTTQRIELSPKIRYKELNFFSFNMTQRFFQYDSKNWTLLYNMTQRLGFFSPKKKLKEFDFLWLTDLNLLFKIFFTQKKWLEELIPFFIVTLKMFFFFTKYEYDSQNWTCFFEHDFFFFDIELFFFFEYDSKKWNSPIRLRGFNFFLWYDSKNWTFFVWLSELNFFFKKYDLTHRIEPLFMNFFSRWQKELKSFFWLKNWTFLVFQCDSMNSLRQTGKKFNALRQVRKKLNSLSQILKWSILWV